MSDEDIAASALARMKRNASTAPKKSTKHEKRVSDYRDPELVGESLERLISERGWKTAAAGGDLLASWSEVVGGDLAAHVSPESLSDGELVLRAESTTWANAATLFAGQIQEAIDQFVGPGVVTRITIRGPVAPSWVKGPRTVKGRGPRDTYG